LLGANRQLADADRRKDEFMAMLAHELRNPLAPIRNAIQILRMIGPQEGNLKRQRELIDRQVTHMARLLDDLLDVSRITRGKITLKKHPVEVADILGQAMETAQPLMASRNHTLHCSPPPRDLRVEGDPDRLAQVVSNFLTHAAKYTNEGGQIWLSAEHEKGQAVIRVRDNGMGIAPDLLEDVFDLFTQSSRSLDRSQGGLGIGLTIVRNLVEMHSGTVKAFSSGPGQGSEFVVRLPSLAIRPQAESTSALRAETVRPEGACHRVLVVEDVKHRRQPDGFAPALGSRGSDSL
jgi:signal transduction histidine kinase